MGLIAEKCPRCRRITRCAVTQHNSVVGGLVFGLPIVVPMSSVETVCGECGHSFKCRAGVEERAIPYDIAAGLDIGVLLRRTNPELHRAQIISELRADPRLRNALALFDRLSPCPLRFGLEAELAGWPSLQGTGQDDLLVRVEKCAKADDFVRALAGRSSFELTGCLLGAVVTSAMWMVAWLTLDRPGALGWALVGVLGLAAGSVPFGLLSAYRGRRWVRDVLIPEAKKGSVPLEWVFSVIEGTATHRGAGDELGTLRDIAPAIRAELVAHCQEFDGDDVGFGLTTGDRKTH